MDIGLWNVAAELIEPMVRQRKRKVTLYVFQKQNDQNWHPNYN